MESLSCSHTSCTCYSCKIWGWPRNKAVVLHLMIFNNFQQTAIHTSYHSCIIVEWGVASETSTHTTVTLCCSFLPAASGSSGLGFGKFNMKKKVFATAKGSVFVTP